MRIIRSLEKSGIFIYGFRENSKKQNKTQEPVFLGILFRTLGASVFRNTLTGK